MAGCPRALGRDEIKAADLAQVVRGLGARRRQDIVEVRTALAQAERASAKAEETRKAAALAAVDAQQADRLRQEAADALDRARSQLADELRRWAMASDIPELQLAAEVAGTVAIPGAPSLTDFVTEELRPRRDALTARQARAEDLAGFLSASGPT